MTKQQLRRFIRQQKEAIPESEILRRSQLLVTRLEKEPVYRQAAAVYGYYPFNQEVRLLSLLEAALAQGKQVALPRVANGQMQFFFIRSLAETVPGYRGIREPAPFCPLAKDPTALVILPGLAFDLDGYRLGYGGGYYDRFLTDKPYVNKMGLAYSFQMLEQIPKDTHDQKLDKVVTEELVYTFLRI